MRIDFLTKDEQKLIRAILGMITIPGLTSTPDKQEAITFHLTGLTVEQVSTLEQLHRAGVVKFPRMINANRGMVKIEFTAAGYGLVDYWLEKQELIAALKALVLEPPTYLIDADETLDGKFAYACSYCEHSSGNHSASCAIQRATQLLSKCEKLEPEKP